MFFTLNLHCPGLHNVWHAIAERKLMQVQGTPQMWEIFFLGKVGCIVLETNSFRDSGIFDLVF